MQPGQLQLPSLSNGTVVVMSPEAGTVVGSSRGVDTVTMTSIMSAMKMVERCMRLCVALVVARGMIKIYKSFPLYICSSFEIGPGRLNSEESQRLIWIM